jgi:hypothetical protein
VVSADCEQTKYDLAANKCRNGIREAMLKHENKNAYLAFINSK